MGNDDLYAANRLEKLKALEHILADRLDGASSRDLPAIAKQYRDTIREIELIEGVSDDDEIGEILQKRQADGKPGAVR